MRRTRHVVLPVKSWQYMGLMVVSLACLTLGLVSRDRGGRSGSLAGPELTHTAPHEVDACPNLRPFSRMSPYDESALEIRSHENLVELRETASSILNKGKNDINDRRTTLNGVRFLSDFSEPRRIRRIDTSRDDRSKKQILMTSRTLNARSNTDRQARESNRYLQRYYDQSTGSRSIEFRERSNLQLRQRKMAVWTHRSSTNDRGTQGKSDVRAADSQRKRLTPQSPLEDKSSGKRREDRFTRSQSNGGRSLGRRIDDYDRRDRRNSIFVRVIRSANGRNTREDRFVRASRSEDIRLEKGTEDRNSGKGESVQSRTRKDRQTLMDLSIKRSTNARRSEARSQKRRSSERREISTEHRDGHVARSIQSSVDVRRSRSERVDRADVQWMGIRSRERTVGRQERDMTRQIERMELRTRSGSNGRKIYEQNTDRSGRQERRIIALSRSSVGQQSLLPKDRLNVLRRERFSREQRFVGQYALNRLEDTERRTNRLERRTHQERQGSLTIRSQIRRSQERRQKPSDLPARSADRQMSESHRAGQRLWMDSLRRNVRTTRNVETTGYARSKHFVIHDMSVERRGRLAETAITRELRKSNEMRGTSRARELRQTSNMDSMRRNIWNSRTSTAPRSERHERLLSRDISQERRGRLAEYAITRELRASNEMRGSSRARELRQTSNMNSMHRNIRNSRTSRIPSSERHERLLTRGISQERRGRLAEGAITRELRASTEMRGSSRARELRQTFNMDSMHRNIRNSRTSRIPSSERHERLLTRDISQERRGRLADGAITRELRTSNEMRGTSRAKELRQTSTVDSMQRNIWNSRTSRIPSSERHKRLLTRDISQERRGRLTDGAITRELRTSNEMRGTSRARELRQTSNVDSMQRNIWNSRTSRISSSERHERLLTRDISQERRGRLAEGAITREISAALPEVRGSRGTDRTNARREHKTITNEIRISRSLGNRRIVNEHIRMNFMNAPEFTAKVDNSEYLRQALVLVLCAVYGVSLLKGKGGLYSFRNIVNPANRLVVW